MPWKIRQVKWQYAKSWVGFKDVTSKGMSVLFLMEEKMTCTCPTMKAQEGGCGRAVTLLRTYIQSWAWEGVVTLYFVSAYKRWSLWPSSIVLYCIALHCIGLHIALHCIALRCIVWAVAVWRAQSVFIARNKGFIARTFFINLKREQLYT